MTLCLSTSRSPRSAATLPKALATSLALVYARTYMGDDMTQSSPRLALTHPTTRLPRAASRGAADRSPPVLSGAPSIHVAHSRHASACRTADPVARKLHQSTPAGVATLAGTSRQTTGPSVADQGGAKMILKEP